MSFIHSPRQTSWDSLADLDAWEEWNRINRHRAHEPRADRDSGVRRHHKPYAKLTGCLRRENPMDWNARPDPLPAKKHIDEQLAA